MFKYIAVSLTSLALIMILSIPVMFMIAGLLARTGSNYYDHGCFDGVTNMILQMDLYDPKTSELEKSARTRCETLVKNLKENGHF